MTLRARIFLLSGGAVAVLLGLIFLFVQKRVQGAARADAERSLVVAARAVEDLAAASRDGQLAQVSLLARLPGIVAALEGPKRDFSALPELAGPRLAGVADLFLLADRSGQVLVARSDTVPGEMLRAAAGEPLAAARESGIASGLWSLGGGLYEVAAAVIEPRSGPAPLGIVALGRRVEEASAARLATLTQSHVVLVAGGEAIDSSLPAGAALEVAAAFPRLSSGRLKKVRLAEEPFLAHAKAIPAVYGGTVHVVLLRSLAASERLTREIRGDLEGIGASAVALVLLAGWLGARHLTEPLRRLGEAMVSMTRSGELRADFPPIGGGPEVELFEGSFRHLIASLERSRRERESSYVEAVRAVVAALDARDRQTTGHSFRVARYAVSLGRRLGLSHDELRVLEWGALLHDIGKIAVPDAVLRKRGPLTEGEWQIMRQHPDWGAWILADVGFLRPAVEVVRNHQECWDGSGYPRGLAGEEVPLGARIFAVVDTYDAITSDRPYRRARGHRAAVVELRRVAGVQLDPRVVEVFAAIPEMELRRLRALSGRAEMVTGKAGDAALASAGV